MNIFYYIKLSYKNLFNKKKYLYKNIFILSITFILMITVLSITKSLNLFIDNNIFKSTLYRTVMVSYEKNNPWNEKSVINKLKNYDFVIDVQKYLYPFGVYIDNSDKIFSNDLSNELILKVGYCNEMPKVINGENLTNESLGVGIIPKKFYPDGSLATEIKKENVSFLNGEDFIGKYITTKYNICDENDKKIDVGTYTFKVIGVYDSVNNIDEANTVYIPYKDLEKIQNYYNEKVKTETNIDIGENYETVIALVDDTKKIEIIENYFSSQMNISAFRQMSQGWVDVICVIVFFIGIGLSIISFIYSIISISLNMFNSIQKRQNEIGILKAIGYTNKHIKRLILCESLIISFISLVVSILISKIILIILNIFVCNNLSIYMQNLKFDISIQIIVIGFVTMFITIVFSSFKSIKFATKVTPAKLVKFKY